MIIEPVGDFRGGKNTNPCRRQLDGQGDAVYFAHDRLDRSSAILPQPDPCLYVAAPIGEKPGRIRRPRVTSVAASLHGQRGHWPYQLPLDVEWRPAPRRERQVWDHAD